MSDERPARPWLRRLALGAGLSALLLLLLHRPLLRAFPRLLVERTPPQSADAIVVLAGAHDGSRVDAGVALYEAGWLRKDGRFLVSGGELYPGATWARLMADRAARRGIPRERILLQDGSKTTEEDAKASLDVLGLRSGARVLLVTSPWHSGRAAPLFRRFASQGIEVLSCPSPDSSPEDWWTDPEHTRALVTEVLKRIWSGPGS
jgi:uncharacterized SAM-binding protein YcdF (DUF218 family)